MISSGRTSINLEDILSRVTEGTILSFYLNIQEVPCIINSPLRQDKHPSFGLYSKDGKKINYTDLSTKDRGGLFDLLGKLWGCSYIEVLEKIDSDIPKMKDNAVIRATQCKVQSSQNYNKNVDLQCKIRDWRDWDIKFWEQFGISIKLLEYAEVYPISHKIIIKDGKKYVFGADKYAYVYIERKEGKVTLKIYQPYNKEGYKWSTNIDRSVWSLWTKIPEKGDNLIISSSLKDCLNLWNNLGIPSICMQGEGYLPKPQVMEELKRRYKNIIVFFDNDYTNPDNPGRTDSIKLADEYNLKRVEIPEEYEAKDPSDLFKKVGKIKYLEIMKKILKNKLINISSKQ